MPVKKSVFKNISLPNGSEISEEILNTSKVRIERIVSKGKVSPDSGWYDQDENEWVLLLKGEGHLEFEDGEVVVLREGEYVLIPKRCKHKVIYSDTDVETIWLALFYGE